MVSPASFTGGGGGGSPPGSGGVTVNIYNPYGARASSSAGAVTTETVTATPSFGTGPYTYAWTQTGTPDATFTVVSPSAAATGFRKASVAAGATYSANFHVTVTDALGATGVSATVTATVYNYGGLGGFIP